MIPCKSTSIKKGFFVVILSVFSFSLSFAQDGKALFNSKCASCHQVLKPQTGPALANLEERHKWADHNELLKWVHNPPGYMATDPYTQGLKAQYGSMMQAFPELTIKELDAIVSYINLAAKPQGPDPKNPPEEPETNNNAVIFGIISLILGLIALILMQ